MKKFIFLFICITISSLLIAQSFSFPMEGDSYKGILTFTVIDQIEYASIVNKHNQNESNAIFDIEELPGKPFQGIKPVKGKLPVFKDIYYLKAYFTSTIQNEYTTMYSEMEMVTIGNTANKYAMQIMYFPPHNVIGLMYGDPTYYDIYKNTYIRGLNMVKGID